MAEAMRAEGMRARLSDVILRPPARFFVFFVGGAASSTAGRASCSPTSRRTTCA
jgi:hypothetical protein